MSAPLSYASAAGKEDDTEQLSRAGDVAEVEDTAATTSTPPPSETLPEQTEPKDKKADKAGDSGAAKPETVGKDADSSPKKDADKTESPEYTTLTPAPPPKVNAWKVKAPEAAAPPPSFDAPKERDPDSPPAPKLKIAKGEKWVPYTPTLVMNTPGSGKRGGRPKPQSNGGGSSSGGGSNNGGNGARQRKAKPRAPHGDKKEGDDQQQQVESSESAGSSAASSGSASGAGNADKNARNKNMRFDRGGFRSSKNSYYGHKPAGGAEFGSGAPGYYAGPAPGAYEYALGLIIGQVEYYFSVENLCKDLYMRRQMNQEGLVPLTLIANFNRVKALAQDPAVFMQACRFAPSLQVVGDRIRLREGWEQWVLPAEERDAAGKQTVDPQAEAFPGLGSGNGAIPEHMHQGQAPGQQGQQGQQQQQREEPSKVSFDVANATPFVPKKQ